MDASLSMNQMQGVVDLKKLHAYGAEQARLRLEHETERKVAGGGPEVNAVGADYDSGPHGGAMHYASQRGRVAAASSLHETLSAPREQELAQQAHAPGKMFSRSDILAILRGRLATLKASAPDVPESARFEIEYVIRIFENLE